MASSLLRGNDLNVCESMWTRKAFATFGLALHVSSTTTLCDRLKMSAWLESENPPGFARNDA